MIAPAPAGKPTFAPDAGFHQALRDRVADYFARTGISPQASGRMWIKTSVFLLWFAASYALLVFVAAAWWQAALLGFSLVLAVAGVAFSVQHDANHGAFSGRRRLDHVLGLTLDLLGGSSYVWRWKHNHAHHAYTNIAGADSDIDAPLGRLSPAQPHRGLHRAQHYYLWGLYALFVVHWQLLQDFHQLVSARIAEQRFPRPRGWRLVELLVGKVVFFGWAFVVPMLFHPWWVVLLCYLAMSVVLSFILVLVFQLAHNVEAAEHPPAPPTATGHAFPRSWAAHQVETTIDFAQRNRLLSWFIGGLNFQIEHHLFPRVCHVHYPQIAPIVRQTCEEFGVRYFAARSVFAALVSHWRWLRQMGSTPPA